MRGLKGKPIVVTGGASGIGRAIAIRLGEEGAIVGILDLNGAATNDVVQAIVANGGGAYGYATDITDYDAVENSIDQFAQQAGGIAGLVNNAGWDRSGRFIDIDRELMRKVVDINLWGPINVTHIMLKRLVAAGGGRIVSIASDAGRVGSSGEAVYSACKGGVIALMKTLARETASKGVTLNTVCPGPTDTPLLAEIGEQAAGLVDALKKAMPMRRLGTPADYPGMVCFLLSDDAAFITGQTISVSGGLTMHG